MKKFATYLLIAVMSVLATACPSKTIATAEKRSAQLAGYANIGVDTTRDLFQAGFISLSEKDRIAVGFIGLAQAGQMFDDTVKNIKAAYVDTAPPRTEIEKLFEVFDSLVVTKFLAILQTMKLISKQDQYAQIIQLIRTAVIAIAKAFGKQQTVALRLETV